MARAHRDRLVRQFFASMPLGSRAAFYAGVFLCFAPLGLLQGAVRLSIEPWSGVAAITLFAGGIAVAYVITILRSPKFFVVPLAVHIAATFWMRQAFPPGPRPDALDAAGVADLSARMTVLVVLTIASTIGAYFSFLTAIRREGLRFSSTYAEMRLARQIHASLVPLVEGRGHGLSWRGSSRPSGDVGGDLVDVVHRGPEWYACVADVTGHGVAAGVLMGMVKAAFRTAVDESPDLGVLVTRLNRTMCPLREPHMFVTAACLRARASGGIEYVLAGHPPLLRVDGRTGRSSWVGESHAAIGLADSTTYAAHHLAVNQGDTLVLITDGLVEIFDRQDREMGLEGLQRVVEQAIRTGGPADLERAVFDACRAHGAQQDDQTMLIVRIEG